MGPESVALGDILGATIAGSSPGCGPPWSRCPTSARHTRQVKTPVKEERGRKGKIDSSRVAEHTRASRNHGIALWWGGGGAAYRWCIRRAEPASSTAAPFKFFTSAALGAAISSAALSVAAGSSVAF
jgi:hypothetical protein